MVFFFFEQINNSILELTPEILHPLSAPDPFLLQLLFAVSGLFLPGLGLFEIVGDFNLAISLFELLSVMLIIAVSFKDKPDAGRVGRLGQFFDVTRQPDAPSDSRYGHSTR